MIACNTIILCCAQGIPFCICTDNCYFEILMWPPQCFLPVSYKASIPLEWHTPWRRPESILCVSELHWIWSLCRSLKQCASNWITDFHNVRWAMDLLKLISTSKAKFASVGLSGVSQRCVLWPWFSQGFYCNLIRLQNSSFTFHSRNSTY